VKRLVPILCIVAMALAVAPVRASHPTGPPRHVLGRTNVIVAKDTSKIAVRLPREAKVALLDATRPNPDVEFTGAGRIVAVALVQDRQPTEYSVTGDEVAGPVEWFSSRWSWCDRPGCISEKPRHLSSAMYWQRIDEDGRIALPPGDYTLYVVTDGAPVRVRLTLHGLKGSTRLAPRSQGKGTINTFQTSSAGGPAVSSGTVENRVDLSSRGLLVLGAHQLNPDGQDGVSGFEHTVNRIDDDASRLSNRVPAFDTEAGQNTGNEEWSFSARPVSAGQYLEQFSAFRAGGSTTAPIRAMSLWLAY
jgi:hypothetical protein